MSGAPGAGRPGRSAGASSNNDRAPHLPPPVYLAAAILFMLLLDRALPLARFRSAWTAGTGAIIAAAGVALHVRATNHFRRRATTAEALGDASTLVTDGPYRRSRNPMYLAGLIMLTGVGLVLGSASPFLVVPLFGWLIWTGYVRREEAMLAERFGEEYDAYRRRVRRWI